MEKTARPLWSHQLPVSPRGLSLARERGWVLVWDTNDWLYLLNRLGQRQAQWHTPDKLVSACAAEDGSAYAAGGERGEVWWLAPDLMPRWTHNLHNPVTSLALDSYGQYLAACDNHGDLHLLKNTGKVVFKVSSPRPLQHLTFIPASPHLVGSAEYGLVACYDVTGQMVWRDGLVANVGSLSASGDGSRIVLACFSEGLRVYSVTNQNQGRLPVTESCRLAALTYDGQLLLAANLGERLCLLDQEGQTLHAHQLDKPAAALGLSPLGETGVVALVDGPVLGLDLRAWVNGH
jgi:hypothetical protein